MGRFVGISAVSSHQAAAVESEKIQEEVQKVGKHTGLPELQLDFMTLILACNLMQMHVVFFVSMTLYSTNIADLDLDGKIEAFQAIM